jgi:hypothetical protein
LIFYKIAFSIGFDVHCKLNPKANVIVGGKIHENVKKPIGFKLYWKHKTLM